MPEDLRANPLVDAPVPLPFDAIRAEHVEPAVRALVEDARARLDAIAAPTEPRGYDDTLGALDALGARLDRAVGVAAH
ncbi:MAG TPA: M3 family peptidase, partial [Minicystis sp.]|nr:M3 family peptidase [Minicystis sp.]